MADYTIEYDAAKKLQAYRSSAVTWLNQACAFERDPNLISALGALGAVPNNVEWAGWCYPGRCLVHAAMALDNGAAMAEEVGNAAARAACVEAAHLVALAAASGKFIN